VSDGGNLAILGARIRTLDPDRPWASAVAIRDDVIVAVGQDGLVANVLKYAGARAVIDLSGRGFFAGRLPAELEQAWVTQDFPLTLVADFFQALATHAGITLHLDVLAGLKRVNSLIAGIGYAVLGQHDAE